MREYGLTLLVTAAVTYLLTPLVRWGALRFRAVIPARERDVHVTPTPRMGGIAMYLGVAAGLVAAKSMVPLRSTFHDTGLIAGLLGAGGLIVIIGIIDDRWGLSAVGKLAGQVVAAGVLFASGAQLDSFPGPNNQLFSLTHNESVVLTILVVVATINAVNFIDGLDGLAAGIVCIAASSFFIYYYSLAKVVGLSAEAVPALASIVLAGACLGFLPHNFYPSRIFMGDTGAMLLGLLLAYVPIWAINSLDYTSLASKANRYPEILPLLLPAAVMVIPYLDLLRAVVRRTRAGKSPFAADNKHLHHRLLEIGHSHRSSVLILYAWAALFAGTVVGLSILTTPLIVLALTTLAAVLVLALLSMPRLRWWERSRAVTAGARPVPSAGPGSRLRAGGGLVAEARAAPVAARSAAQSPNPAPADGRPRASGPVSGGPVSGGPVSGELVSGGPVSGGLVSGELVSGGPVSAGLVSGGPVSGGPVSGGLGPGDPGADRQSPNGSRGRARAAHPVEPAPVQPLDETVPMPLPTARASGKIVP